MNYFNMNENNGVLWIRNNKIPLIVAGISLVVGLVVGVLIGPGATTTFVPSIKKNEQNEIKEKVFTTLAKDQLTHVRTSARGVLVTRIHNLDQSLAYDDWFVKNADTPYLAASLTKLASLYAYQNSIGFSTPIIETTQLDDVSIEGVNFPIGMDVTSKDIAAAMLIPSSNGAAHMLGRVAQKRGIDLFEVCKNTLPNTIKVSTLSGLDDTSSMTTRDAVYLAAQLNNLIRDVVSVSTASEFKTDNKGLPFVFKNTNPLVAKNAEIYFSKTGYTDVAGGNLVILARVCNENFGVAVMGETFEGRFTVVQNYINTLLNSCKIAQEVIDEPHQTSVIQ